MDGKKLTLFLKKVKSRF